MSAQPTIVADGLDFPEGPVALADGSLLVVEIGGGNLTRVWPDGRRAVVAHLGGGPNGAALGPDGKVYVCNNGGFAWLRSGAYPRPIGNAPDYTGGRIETVDLATGAVETLYTHCGDVQLSGPNDIVFDADGGMWFTDFGKADGHRMARGAVFYARTDGSFITEAIFPLWTPNGIGLSPDGRTLYVSETETSRLWRFAVTGPGELAREPWPSPHGGILHHGLPGYQRFDSLAVEDSGNICVATMVTPGIYVFAPDGALVGFERMAAEPYYCTNICFGGPDRRTAYITLSSLGQLVAVPWPRPGLALHDGQ